MQQMAPPCYLAHLPQHSCLHSGGELGLSWSQPLGNHQLCRCAWAIFVGHRNLSQLVAQVRRHRTSRNLLGAVAPGEEAQHSPLLQQAIQETWIVRRACNRGTLQARSHQLAALAQGPCISKPESCCSTNGSATALALCSRSPCVWRVLLTLGHRRRLARKLLWESPHVHWAVLAVQEACELWQRLQQQHLACILVWGPHAGGWALLLMLQRSILL